MTLKEDVENFKQETKKLAYWSYNKGRIDALYCVKKTLSVMVGKQVEPPITIEDIVKLVDSWLKETQNELKEVK